jgi:putative MATE family efflux protein
MTAGSPSRALIRYTLPILAGEFFYLFYNIADTMIVGRLLGMEALAGVGSVAPLVSFVFGFAIGCCNGFSIVLAQRYGAGDKEGVRRSAACCLFLTIILSVFFTAVLLPLARPVLRLMKTPPEIIDMAHDYLFVIFAGVAVTFISTMYGDFLYSIGNSKIPLYFSVAATLLNIGLDVLFIAVFHWGTAGAAVATVIAQGFTLVLCYLFLAPRFADLTPSLKEIFTAPLTEIKAHLFLGLSIGAQRCIVEVGNIFVQAAVNALGMVEVAAVTAAQRVRQLNMLPLFSVSRGVITFTAQNYGAGKMDRVGVGLRQACLISLGCSALMAAVNFPLGGAMASIFLKGAGEGEAAALAWQFTRYVGATVWLLGIMLNFRGAMQGLGDPVSPTVCSVLETAMSVITAFLFIPSLGFTGVCLANPLSWLASGIPVYIAYLRFFNHGHHRYHGQL